jgi:hypothetical protein
MTRTFPAGGGVFPGRRAPRPELERLEDRCLLAVNFATEPVIPTIDYAMKAHLQAVFAQGVQQGNRPDVFSKVGDSITAYPGFLYDLGSPTYNPANANVGGAYTNLAPTIAFFKQQPVDGQGNNSFNHVSLAAQAGWTTWIVLGDGGANSPLAAELNQTRPAVALIMLGTNENILGTNPETYRTLLTNVVNTTLAHGVIPVLSTIPDDYYMGGGYEAGVPVFNQVIAEVAASLDVPLWNYWLVMQPLPNFGLDQYGVHPSASSLGTGNFTPLGLLSGYNIRNLTAVLALDKVLRVVMENGPADCGNGPLPPEIVQYVTGLFNAVLGRAPDPAGLAGWGRMMQCGVPRAQLAEDIWDSPEHRGLEVDQYFNSYLHRSPQPGERAAWVGAFLSGLSETDVQRAIISSAEYQAAHASDTAFVQGLFQDVLGRNADSDGQAFWLNSLSTNPDRAALAQDFLISQEKARQVIDGYFTSFLKRPADAAGEQALLGLVLGGTSLEGIGQGILAGDEFAALSQ